MRIEQLLLVACAMAGGSAAACVEQSPVSPAAPTLVVHAVLDASARDQYVIVQYTDGLVSHQQEVTGAVVSITAPDGQVLTGTETRDTTLFATQRYMPRVGTVYRVALGESGVRLVAGGTYHLRVVAFNNGVEVTGTTTIPGLPGAVSTTPQPREFLRARDTLALAWPRVALARSYEVSVATSEGGAYAAFADTAMSLPGTLFGERAGAVFVAGLRHEVAVSAVDINYYDYFRRGSNNLTGLGPLNHLTGGVGLFGSMARVETLLLDVR